MTADSKRLVAPGVVAAVILVTIGPAFGVSVAAEADFAGAIAALALFYLTIAMLTAGAAILWSSRAVRKPRAPRRKRARRAFVGFEPKKMIDELSRNCVICGRPLTNAVSMRARVGSTCIKTYGPRFKKMPNPAHTAWRARVTKAEVDQVVAQSQLDAEFGRQLEEHRVALSQRAAWLDSADGKRTRARSFVGACWLTAGVLLLPISVLVAGVVALVLD